MIPVFVYLTTFICGLLTIGLKNGNVLSALVRLMCLIGFVLGCFILYQNQGFEIITAKVS